jgi:hypothetical protein
MTMMVLELRQFRKMFYLLALIRVE